MEKKIICILVSMLMCATVFTVTGTQNEKVDAFALDRNQTYVSNYAPWDLLDVIDVGATGETGANGNAGAEFDGTYQYSTRWAANLIHRYDIDGNLVEEFSIAGVSGLRDLAFDGSHMWGGAAAGTIWEMDFTAKTLISTITGTFQSRAIMYDYDEDEIHCSNWGDPVWVVNPTTGAINSQYNLVTATSTYGFAYDPNPAGLTMWIFDQTTGATSTIYEWDMVGMAMTGFTYNVNADVGSGIGIAGGLWASADYAAGLFCLGGCVQDSSAPGVTDWLFVYELYTTNLPPNTPGAPSGPDQGVTGVDYTFTATTTDPEGDPIEYWFDWGDGENSGWVSKASATHAWASPDTFDVTVKARDAVHGGESGFSPAHEIEILGGAVLDIKLVKGGIGKIKVTIENIGGVAATGVEWTISLVGGAFIGKESAGIVDVPAGGSAEFSSKFIMGLGKTAITVTATHPESTDTATRSGTILFFYVYVRPGGG